MDSISELERQLLHLVSSASDVQTRTYFSVARFRESAARTLADFREDQRSHGLDEASPFFDLIMFDANPVEPAVFVVPMFFTDCVKIFVGTGVPSEVITMANQFAMADVEGMAAELRSIGVSNSLDIPRILAEHWLAGA